MERTGQIFRVLKQHNLDCVILKDSVTIRYLTGFTGDSTLFYADNMKAVLITDGRYAQQAGEESKLCRVMEYTQEEGLRQLAAAARLAGQAKKIAFDGFSFTYDEAKELRSYLPEGASLESIDLRYMRAVKSERELKDMWQAFKIADGAFERLLKELKAGMTEIELAARLEYYMRSLGSEGTSFDTIVASGYRSALPHARPTDKAVEIGDFVTFDFGAIYGGYHSDTTRTVVMGMANSWHKEIYTLVEEAHYRGIKYAKAGMKGSELDAMIREYIASRGYGKYFIHGLGHGVGLEIHELPNINRRGDMVLEPSMVFTIEPGIYIPGRGGVRIEDTVVLTEDGAKSLTGLKKQLLEIV